MRKGHIMPGVPSSRGAGISLFMAVEEMTDSGSPMGVEIQFAADDVRNEWRSFVMWQK